ncbi:hypothetical protein C8Q77DRAFT_1131990 [Trametes polyzona]|nr:hypothetical protein C8Q77DRAFT_1131990 [Trametes polyzona]
MWVWFCCCCCWDPRLLPSRAVPYGRQYSRCSYEIHLQKVAYRVWFCTLRTPVQG